MNASSSPAARRPSTFNVMPLARCGRQREFQLPAKRVPVALVWIFPAAKPFQAVGDVADFVAINLFEQLRRGVVAHRGKAAREMPGEIQVGLLERQAQAGNVVHRVFHDGHGAPEVAAHGQLAEMDAAFLHALEVKPGVFLFVLEGLQHALAERGGCIGKTQQHQRHQFGGEQFVIGKKVEQASAFAFLFEVPGAGKFAAAPCRSL